jgi:hypothetical protein
LKCELFCGDVCNECGVCFCRDRKRVMGVDGEWYCEDCWMKAYDISSALRSINTEMVSKETRMLVLWRERMLKLGGMGKGKDKVVD